MRGGQVQPATQNPASVTAQIMEYARMENASASTVSQGKSVNLLNVPIFVITTEYAIKTVHAHV